ncbi:MAG TPA: ribbon-helix-helix protein, CopG family [Thermomicrobiales bacterium]|nr:ribbon-helix-helix protein, CopG family [Thermomicrobiales bacterium]
MALTRKNLMVDAEQLAALAARRGVSESAAVREAVETALFAEEFGAAMEALRATGYGADEPAAGDKSAPDATGSDARRPPAS